MLIESKPRQEQTQIDVIVTMNKSKLASRILFSAALILTLLTLFVVVRQAQGYQIPPALTAVFGLLALLTFASLRLPRQHQYKVIMVFCSVLFTVYMVEQFLYWWGNPLDFDNERFMAALQEGVNFDRRDSLDVYLDMKEEGVEAYPYVPPSNFVWKSPLQKGDDKELFFPLGSISNATTIYCNETGDYTLYESDKYGFNNPPGTWKARAFDVALVGDSFVQGACIPPDKNIPALIREEYPKTVSLGGSGNGPMLMLASIKEYMLFHKPELVLWFYFEGNDLIDLQAEKNNDFVMQYYKRPYTQKLIFRQDEVDKMRKDYIKANELTRLREGSPRQTRDLFSFWSTLRFYQVRRLLNLTFENGEQTALLEPMGSKAAAVAQGKIVRQDVPDDEKRGDKSGEPTSEETTDHYKQMIAELPENLPLLRNILDDANQTVQSWDGEMIVVYIPQWERYTNDVSDRAFQRLEVLPIFEALELEVIDFKPVMDEHPDPLSLYPFRINGHFNEAGYELLAETILEALEER